MSRRVAATASAVDRALRAWELRETSGQADRVGRALVLAGDRADLEEVVRREIDEEFLKANRVSKEVAVRAILSRKKEIVLAMKTSEEDDYSRIEISNTVGPINIGGTNVTQSQNISVGDVGALAEALARLGFSDREIVEQRAELDQLPTKSAKSVKSLARRVSEKAGDTALKVSVGSLSSILAGIYLRYLGLA